MASPSSLTGQQLQALAYAQKPIEPKGFALGMEIMVVIWTIIATTIVCLRVLVRLYWFKDSTIWGIDDYLAVIGYLLYLPANVFCILAIRYGLGSFDSQINQLMEIRVGEYQVYWEFLTIISSSVTKCSIAAVCIRLTTQRNIKWVLWANMVVTVLPVLGGICFMFANCQPFAATWNPALGTCKSATGLITVSYIVTAVQISTDWVSAITPFFILRELQMPNRTKITVMMLLGLGIAASIGGVMRTIYFKYYDTAKYPSNYIYHIGFITFWSVVEVSLCIIACSLPPLYKLYKHSGGTTKRNQSGGLNESNENTTPSIQLDHFQAKGNFSSTAHISGGRANDWSRPDDDSISSKRNIIVWERTVDVESVDASQLEGTKHRK